MNIGQNWNPAPLITRDIMERELQLKAIRIHQQSVFGLTANMFANLKESDRADLYSLISHDFDFDHINDAFEFCVEDRSYCKVMVKVGG